MSHIPNAPASEAEKQERIQNALFNVGYNAEFSRRGAIKAALALAGSAVLFGLPGRAYAARASQKTLDALATAEEKLAAVEAELEQLAAEFQALSLKQEKTIAQIDDVQTQIDETQEQIEEKQQELEDKQDVLASRVSDSYKDGPGSTLKLLLAAKSFDELLSNSRYVEKINDADKQVISEIQQIRESLEQQKAELEQQKTELETLRQQQADQLSDMQAKQGEVQTLVDGLSSDVKELMAQRDAEYLAAVEEERRQQEAQQQHQQSGGGTTYLPGNAQVSGSSRSQERVVSCCHAVPSPGAGYCAMWVSRVFAAAGFSYLGGNANDMYNRWCTSSNKDNLRVGMIVAVSTYSKNTMGRIYGHVGIYVGNNTVMENIGGIASTNLDRWISYYGDTVSPRWGWAGGWALE